MKHRELTAKIIAAACKVHNTLGFGFLEKVYENALAAGFTNSQCRKKIRNRGVVTMPPVVLRGQEIKVVSVLLGVTVFFWCLASPGARAGGVAAAGSTERKTGRPHRLYPAYEHWMVPVKVWVGGPPPLQEARETFRVEARDKENQIEYAEWRLEGPEPDEKRHDVLREDGRASSQYQLRVKTPGEYELTCTIFDKRGTRSSLSWFVTVDDDKWAGYGREVDPGELGTMVFIKGGAFTMGAPSASSVGGRDAVPAHEVSVDDFCIGEYLVTAKGFCEFLNERDNPGYRYLMEDEKVVGDWLAELETS